MLNDYYSYRAAQFAGRFLPRRFAYWVALRVADKFFARDRAGREAVMANLCQIFKTQRINPSENKLRAMARKNFQNFGKYLIDFFKFSHLTMKDIKRLISFEHFEYLEQACARGKGVIFITAHLGSWELAAAAISTMGYRISAVVLSSSIGKINDLFQRQRIKRGIQVIPVGFAARKVMQALKRNECVAMLADRDYTRHHDLIDFFGMPSHLPSGPARIAVKTGATIVPIFMLRQDDDTFLMRFHPPIIPRDNTKEIQLKIRDIMEKEIAANPSQWFMFEKFFVTDNKK